MMDHTERRATIRLHLAEGVAARTLGRLREAFGSAAGAVAATPGQLQAVKGIGVKTAEAIAAVTDADVDAELAAAERAGAVLCVRGEPGYPRALETITDPPEVLYVRGELRDTDAVAVGIVGARRCSHYGLEQAQRFGELLARAGLTVVSGGARGIDTAAHRGALTAGGRTLAVMGCGLSQTYPRENRKLFDRIIAEGRGALVSELPMGVEIRAGNFHARNRIISGLSLGVLLVEAARRSGSLITARRADEQGRLVFAVPGRVDSPTSAGTNELIRDGAILTQNLDDLLEQLGPIGAALAESQDAPPPLPPGLTATETTLLEALAGGELTLDELTRHTKLSSAEAAASMTMLVIKGAVAQKPGNVFARKVRGGND
ncbi:MAG: DNA-processing protein DprA [Phycisphaerae bacterium]|nr:DNA-processing protein DprA [Phycisphaerae bacterium]